jgi:hypothetical protein
MQFTHIPDGFACMLALHSAHSLHSQQQSARVADERSSYVGGPHAHIAGGELLVLHWCNAS